MNIVQEGVGVRGDQVKFAQYSHLATRLLEVLCDRLHDPIEEDQLPEMDEDHIVGRYIYINPPVWGGEARFSTRNPAMDPKRSYSSTQQAVAVANTMAS